MKSTLRLVMALAFSVFALAGPASAQATYTSSATVNTSGSVKAGEVVTVSGEAPGGAMINAKVDGASVGTHTVAMANNTDASGMVAYSFNVTLPSNLAAGAHTLSIEVDGTVVSTTTINVAAQQAANTTNNTAQSAGLANTGAESTPLALVALGLIGAGSLALIARRRMVSAA